MTGGKKWVLVVTDEQHEWLSNVSKKTELKGSDIFRELLTQTMEDDEKFVASLVHAPLRIQQQDINNKIAALEEQLRELQKKYKGEKVAA